MHQREHEKGIRMSFARRVLKRITIPVGSLLLLFIGFNVFWDTAPPQVTCASCHEIESSSSSWAHSGHRALSCRDCHGTAFTNGIHSVSEKIQMVVRHFNGSDLREIKMNETQVVEMIDNCCRCHAAEYSGWTSSGHSATYAAIFLNENHNSTEQLNPDCLRCHGMYYDGTIQSLVTPLSVKGPWRLKDVVEAERPAIPCLSCHQMHRTGTPSQPPDYSNPQRIFYETKVDSLDVLFYDRYEKIHLDLNELPPVQLKAGGRTVKVSGDPVQRLCTQCHSPNSFHVAGTSDDRTLRGVHEGLPCEACHDVHSNEARQSCVHCHPAISNCGLDVKTMNTTYADRGSRHNIHFVACKDCHAKGIPKKKVS